ncbi:phospholipase D-like domain-containing protein [Terrisporobacter vanillatitrophus]|uniref:phospholipase D-like domain-containing protein n=1 Tax=Terrisporobacter vanillatitrophus TaxID=3058402 RepID=UPI0033683898
MQKLISFYKCKNIENQLTIVMREILINNLTDVVIYIPEIQDTSYILNYLHKRNFLFSYGIEKNNLPILHIGNNAKCSNVKNEFYVMFEEFTNKETIIESIKHKSIYNKYILFNSISDDILNKIKVYDFEIKDYLGKIVNIINENSGDNGKKEKNKIKPILHLVDKDIRNKFLNSFLIAESEVDIISPWMNSHVVDDDLMDLMESLLIKGIKLKIIYGIGDDTDKRNQKSNEVAYELKSRFREYGDLFKIKKSNIHYKLLLCDEKFAILGSFNFLSFKGEYNGNDDRGEGAELIIDKENIRNKREFYFNF